jgi:transcriptional regulator of acetoin/glycerol metabolism/AraC-like DNA-binding protein
MGKLTARLSHPDQIESVLDSGLQDFRGGQVSESWRRSAADHHIDPESQTSPNIITEKELKISREPLENLILQAREEMDRLYAIVRHAGYVVLLCNTQGIAIYHRGNERMSDRFRYWGTWLGGVWSEEVEGTNGIGTCITEQRPISVHLDQHFRSRHMGLSCAGAPIFDANGILAAILDTSSIVPGLAAQSHALALAATITSARAIEERLFREHFHDIWIVAALPCDESHPAILLALDRDKRIVGADRAARKTCGLDDRLLEKGIQLSTLFEETPSVVLRNQEEDVALQLVRTRDAQLWYVLITPPGLVSKRRSMLGAETHTRPRIGSLGSSAAAIFKEDAHGGLPPASIRRVRDYIDSHLNENITIETLATTVGLSVYHFARAFKHSIGMPPHEFILRRRVERANQMLHRTVLPLSEIAAAVGFSDQSHFARHFRRQTGMTPSVARWTQR